MSNEQQLNDSEDNDDTDEIAEFVQKENIKVIRKKIDVRPDVAVEEQLSWQKQDPDYPLEHYRCTILFGDKSLDIFQTVGADYPDEDEDADNSDLYSDARELLLSPEFLLESAALKANSVDQSKNLDEWVRNKYCETMTPLETYQYFLAIRSGLINLLGEDKYNYLVKLAIEADEDRDDEELL